MISLPVWLPGPMFGPKFLPGRGGCLWRWEVGVGGPSRGGSPSRVGYGTTPPPQ